ncbi:MAG: hydroxymethylglutaryl-CoA synthase [Gammaproteobacteria bacterium]|nr:hydroxymethylglutaryl-CoA synthase [Gammaproteobacteria bacterium]
MSKDKIGISGFSVYVPPLRVDLQRWCEWTGNCWEKIKSVVGRGFRMRAPTQSIYTFAATAVLRLIKNYDLDPRRIKFLGLGTESSTDNAAGAIIIKGMVDDALRKLGLPTLARDCEVPEFKHACLGGVYGIKSAVRFLAHDGGDAQAIVVSADIAEYARGSSGEPTQGAGAVAMLLERDPKIAEVHLNKAGSASDYRAIDFRKPFSRFAAQPARSDGQLQDLPVFNGKYSTTCYVDQTMHAMNAMFDRRQIKSANYCRELEAVFMHRPYQRMPETGWALAYLFALARGTTADHKELEEYCQQAGIAVKELIAEMTASPRIRELVESNSIDTDAYPLAMQVLRVFRSSNAYQQVVTNKLSLGGELMQELGNLYTGALPAWLAAGFEEAQKQTEEFNGGEILAVGYGSGDAAEVIPLTVCEDWRNNSARIGFQEALSDAVDLSQNQYETLHDQGSLENSSLTLRGDFIIDKVGGSTGQFCDQGVEYYRYLD